MTGSITEYQIRLAFAPVISLSGVTAGKKYYVQIRTYKTAKGVKHYSDWSAKKTGFIFNGSGYYDEEGIWHDPDVEE